MSESLELFDFDVVFDEGKLVVLFNGFQKKTQKTPKGELEKGLKLMSEYFEQKH